MDTGLIIFILALIAVFCYIVYNDMSSKYTKLEECFDWFKNRSLVRFEFEKSPLHTIVNGGTGTGNTSFVRKYLKMYQEQDGTAWSETHQEQDNKQMVEQDIKQDQEQVNKDILEQDNKEKQEQDNKDMMDG